MIQFIPLKLEHFPQLRPYFDTDFVLRRQSEHRRRSCDYTPGTTFMWREYFRTEYAEAADTLLLRARYFDGSAVFTFPIGSNPAEALALLRDECRAAGTEARFCFAVADDVPALREVFGNAEAIPEPDWFDYLYDRAAFAALSGKKYHGQRNFVNRFAKLYPDAKRIPITEANTALAARFCEEQYAKFPNDAPMAAAEHTAILEVLANWTLYGMSGQLLTVGESVAGMTIGEAIGDTLYVHVEKADTNFVGAYPTLAAGYAGSFANPTLYWLNREEDMGEPGLRRAKESWHPAGRIEKYTVICR